MPELQGRATKKGETHIFQGPWRLGGHWKNPRRYVSGQPLEEGTWTVELLRDGHPLEWTETVVISSGRSKFMKLPDVTTLK